MAYAIGLFPDPLRFIARQWSESGPTGCKVLERADVRGICGNRGYGWELSDFSVEFSTDISSVYRTWFFILWLTSLIYINYNHGGFYNISRLFDCKQKLIVSHGYGIACLHHLWGYVITRVGNLTEEKSPALYEISGMAILVPILYQKQELVNF